MTRALFSCTAAFLLLLAMRPAAARSSSFNTGSPTISHVIGSPGQDEYKGVGVVNYNAAETLRDLFMYVDGTPLITNYAFVTINTTSSSWSALLYPVHQNGTFSIFVKVRGRDSMMMDWEESTSIVNVTH